MTTSKIISSNLKPIWLMWSVSNSIFHSRQRNSGGEPCMEKWVMMSFSLAMDFHFLYSSSTFFFRLKRDSWGTLFCLKNAWREGSKKEAHKYPSKNLTSLFTPQWLQCTCSGAGKQDSVCEAQLWGVKFIMVWRMSLHQVPWMESEPVKKSTNKTRKFRRPLRLNLQVSVSYEHKSMKGHEQTGKWDTVIKKIYSEGYLWHAWLWPGWGSRLCSAPQTQPTEPSWGRWGSGWTVAALPNCPELWSTAGLCSQHWGERHKDKVMEHVPPDDSFFVVHIIQAAYRRFCWYNKAFTTDAAGSGWSGEQQPDCAGDWAAGLCSAAGCGASCSWTSPVMCEGFPRRETWRH